MIETAEALENLDAILNVPRTRRPLRRPRRPQPSARRAARCGLCRGAGPGGFRDDSGGGGARHGVVAGVHTATPGYARKIIAKGFRFVTIDSDLRYLSKGAKAVVDAFQGRG